MKNIKFPPALFVTGTDTDVGKTMVAAMLAIGLKGGYWKPVQSGLEPQTDTEWIKAVSGLPEEHFFPETYRLTQHLSPHASAKIDNVAVKLSNIQLPDHDHLPHLIIEGAGGLMVPLNDHEYVIDMIKHLRVPVLVVSRSTLGTINHTLLTIEKLRSYSIPIFGVILNGPKNPSNHHAISHYGRVPILGELEHIPHISREALYSAFNSL